MPKNDDVQDAAASGISLSLLGGLASFPVDFIPMAKTSAKSIFKTCCPTCDGAQAGKQLYRCAAEHEWSMGAAAHAVNVPGHGLVRVSGDEYAEVKQLSNPDVMELTPYRRDAVDGLTVTDGNKYRLRPPAKAANKQMYALVRKLAEDPEIVLVGECVIRGGKNLYALEVWGGQLVATGLMRPSDVAPTEDVPTEVDEAKYAAVKKMLAGQVEEFTVDLYRSETVERATALLEAKTADPTSSKPDEAKAIVVEAAGAGTSLDALLAAINDMKPEKKAPAKKAVAA